MLRGREAAEVRACDDDAIVDSTARGLLPRRKRRIRDDDDEPGYSSAMEGDIAKGRPPRRRRPSAESGGT